MADNENAQRVRALKEAVRVDLADRLAQMSDASSADVERMISAAVRQTNERAGFVGESDIDGVVEDIADEYLRLGPIQKLLADETISEIMVNGGGLDDEGNEMEIPVYIERRGKIEPAPDVVFDGPRQKRQIIERIASWCGRTVNEEMPILNARLPDGSRVCAVIQPIAIDGDTLDIRRFRKEMLSMGDLVRIGTMTPEMSDLLAALVKARCNIIVSGGTGSGKTTMLNCLSEHIPESERIVTIEDTAELQLAQRHTLRYEGRPANSEGAGKITIHDLVVMSLRDRPDRIIVGECRSDETLEMLQAMQTGHDGSLTTIHANDPQTAFKRIETMVLGASEGLPSRAIREQIAQAVDIIVQVARLVDGTRRVTAIEAVTGMEGDAIVHEPLFELKERGRDEHGRVIAEFCACGTLPPEAIRKKLEGQGVEWKREWFFGSQTASMPEIEPETAPAAATAPEPEPFVPPAAAAPVWAAAPEPADPEPERERTYEEGYAEGLAEGGKKGKRKWFGW